MIFSKECDIVSVRTSDVISDHFSIVADLKIPAKRNRTVPQPITYHKLQAINFGTFKADIENSELIKYPKTDASELAQLYDSVLSTIIDFHAFLVTKNISPNPPNLLMTLDILGF